MKFESDELLKIVAKLVGPVEPVGDENVDEERLENLKQLIGLMKNLHILIDRIAINKTSYYHSEKVVGECADEYLNWLGIPTFVPKLKRMPLGFYSFTPDSVGLVMVGNHELHEVHTAADAVQIGDYYISIHDLERLPKEE